MKPRKKLIAFAAVTGAIVVLAVAGVVFQEAIRERYYLWRLETGSEDEKRHAAGVLGRLKSEKAVPLLADLLGTHGFPLDDADILDALVDIGPPAVERLLFIFATYGPSLRETKEANIGAAIVRIGEPAVPALSKIYRESGPRLRQAAIRALQSIGGPEVTTLLREALLNDASDRIRFQALDALAWSVSRSASSAYRLRAFCLAEEDLRVRDAAETVVKRLFNLDLTEIQLPPSPADRMLVPHSSWKGHYRRP